MARYWDDWLSFIAQAIQGCRTRRDEAQPVVPVAGQASIPQPKPRPLVQASSHHLPTPGCMHMLGGCSSPRVSRLAHLRFTHVRFTHAACTCTHCSLHALHMHMHTLHAHARAHAACTCTCAACTSHAHAHTACTCTYTRCMHMHMRCMHMHMHTLHPHVRVHTLYAHVCARAACTCTCCMHMRMRCMHMHMHTLHAHAHAHTACTCNRLDLTLFILVVLMLLSRGVGDATSIVLRVDRELASHQRGHNLLVPGQGSGVWGLRLRAGGGSGV